MLLNHRLPRGLVGFQKRVLSFARLYECDLHYFDVRNMIFTSLGPEDLIVDNFCQMGASHL